MNRQKERNNNVGQKCWETLAAVTLSGLTFSLLQLLRLLRLLGHQCGLVGERLPHQAVGSRVGG